MRDMPRNTILVGDAYETLTGLPAESVHCVISSPPFFALRDYGVTGQIGLEGSVDQWVERLHSVMVELHRVLTPTGSLWLDFGDAYSRNVRSGAPSKSLYLSGERLALRMIGDGWILRNRICWLKTNPMPQAVTDRLSNTYDLVFHFVRENRYFYDVDSLRLPYGEGSLVGKDPGDSWRLPAANYRGPHHATFPEQLVERPLLATCPLRVCSACNLPWKREPAKIITVGKKVAPGNDQYVRRYRGSWRTLRRPGPLAAGCVCGAPTQPGLVLDPFFGTGTVGVAAERLGRDWCGIELSSTYASLAYERLGRAGPEQAVAA